MTPPPVRIGQVYRDRDPRMSGRYLRVVDLGVVDPGELGAFYEAACEHVSKRDGGGWVAHPSVSALITRLDRLTSSRFELVEDVTG